MKEVQPGNSARNFRSIPRLKLLPWALGPMLVIVLPSLLRRRPPRKPCFLPGAPGKFMSASRLLLTGQAPCAERGALGWLMTLTPRPNPR